MTTHQTDNDTTPRRGRLRRGVHAALLIAAVALAVAGCANPLSSNRDVSSAGTPAESDTGSLEVRLEANTLSTQTIRPDLGAAVESIDRYEVSLSRAGYDERAESADGESTSVDFSAVPTGEWTVTVAAYDGDDTRIAEGSTTVDIGPGDNSASVDLSYLSESGNGSISITIEYPADAGVSTISATLTDENGDAETLTLSVDTEDGTASWSGTRAAGAYDFVAELKDENDTVLARVVEAVNNYGNLSSAGTVTLEAHDISGPPAAPKNMAVTRQSDGTLEVSWLDSSPIETGYDIGTSTNGTDWSETQGLEANTTQYGHQGYELGKTNYYRVRATNDFGASSWLEGSDTLPATYFDITGPIDSGAYDSYTDGGADTATIGTGAFITNNWGVGTVKITGASIAEQTNASGITAGPGAGGDSVQVTRDSGDSGQRAVVELTLDLDGSFESAETTETKQLTIDPLRLDPIVDNGVLVYSSGATELATKKSEYTGASSSDGTTHVSDVDTRDYTTSGDGEWVRLDTDVNVSNDDYSEGFVEIVPAGGADFHADDELRLVTDTDRDLKIDGQKVLYDFGNGYERVGTLSETQNGGVRVDFTSKSLLDNADFEDGNLDGWTAMEQFIDLGSTVIAGRTSQDTSTYSNNSQSGGNDDDVPSSATYDVSVSTEGDPTGQYALKLTSNMTTKYGYDVVHGPAVYSDPFRASAGDQIQFDWRAYAGSDDFDAFGYVLNTDTGQQTEVIDATGGSNTAWTTKSTTIPADGEYRFVFVNGTYDASGGLAAGGTLYIDNILLDISVVSADEQVVEAIVESVEYRRTANRPGGVKALDVRVDDSDGDTAVDDTATIRVTDAPRLYELTESSDSDEDGTVDRWEGSTVYAYNNGSWTTVADATVQSELGYVRTVTNPKTSRSFEIFENRVEPGQ